MSVIKLLAPLALFAVTACADTTVATSATVQSAVYNRSVQTVAVTMSSGQSYVFSKDQICGKTRGQIGGHTFTLTGTNGPLVWAGGVLIQGLVCPSLSGGGNTSFVLDTSPTTPTPGPVGDVTGPTPASDTPTTPETPRPATDSVSQPTPEPGETATGGSTPPRDGDNVDGPAPAGDGAGNPPKVTN